VPSGQDAGGRLQHRDHPRHLRRLRPQRRPPERPLSHVTSRTDTHARTHARPDTHTLTDTHTHTCAHRSDCTFVRTHTRTRARARTYTHARTRARVHTHPRTCTICSTRARRAETAPPSLRNEATDSGPSRSLCRPLRIAQEHADTAACGLRNSARTRSKRTHAHTRAWVYRHGVYKSAPASGRAEPGSGPGRVGRAGPGRAGPDPRLE
jgi:hypothetical protein